MAEYIEREKIISELEDCLVNIGNLYDDLYYGMGINKGLTEAISAIKSAPLADVRPERHGKWEKSCDGYSYFCSICKEEPDRSGRLLSDFCPWCGAKMGGKDGE